MFFFFFHLIFSGTICELCTTYGKPALSMARSGKSSDEIRPVALKKCDILPQPFIELCKKVANTMLENLIEEAKTSNKTAEEYCKERKFC